MIKSNVGAVLARMKFLEAKVPEMMTRVLGEGQRWDEVATRTAERTLLALAEPDERGFVGLFVATIVTEVFGESGGFDLSMKEPGTSAGAVDRAIGAVDAQLVSTHNGQRHERRNPGNLGMGDQATVDRVKEGILGWVRDEKRKLTGPGEMDEGLSDEEIAQRIGWILFDPYPAMSERMKSAREKLAPHIQDYMIRQDREAAGLRGETVDGWLRAVLAAWRSMIQTQLPEKVRQEFAKLRGQLRAELPLR